MNRPKRYKNYKVLDGVAFVPESTERRHKISQVNNNIPDNPQEIQINEDVNILVPEVEQLPNELSDDICDQLFESSRSSSESSLLDVEATYNSLPKENNLDWVHQKLYENSEETVGSTIYELLYTHFKNANTKTNLTDNIKLLNKVLPNPNNFVKNTYYFMACLKSLYATKENLVKKHRLCEKCLHYLGLFSETKNINNCLNCNSVKLQGAFYEFDLRQLLKSSFEYRDLKNLIDEHKKSENSDPEFISDFTSGSEYLKIRLEYDNKTYDIFLLWNVDGTPVSESSLGQVWLIQAQILNIPPKYRRSNQFLLGIYYSTETHPQLTSFLKPFVDSLIDVYQNKIEWFCRDTKDKMYSRVIAPVATLDCPARAAASNFMQYNGVAPCTACEHPRQTCKTGSGHNRVFPTGDIDYQLRTHEEIAEQASLAFNNSEPVHGIKGPSITLNLPHFDLAKSFVQDYLHAVLLGVMKMLLNLWCDTKNKNKIFFLNKSKKEAMDREILKIITPDNICRPPRSLKHRGFFKASELRSYLLFYLLILLKGKLPTNFYNHFLLLSYSINILLKEKISKDELLEAKVLLNLFVENVEFFYGLEKCSFNVHQLTHLADSVAMYGPLWAWSAFNFEDAIGYFKRNIHGPNKIDIELANTMTMLNSYYILRDKVNKKFHKVQKCSVFGKPIMHTISMMEMNALCYPPLSCNIEMNMNISVFKRASKFQETFTSILYTKQKKKCNYVVSWDEGKKHGIINYFIKKNEKIFAIIQETVSDHKKKINSSQNLNFTKFIKPIRLTYAYHAVEIENIHERILTVDNYICIPPNCVEKK